MYVEVNPTISYPVPVGINTIFDRASNRQGGGKSYVLILLISLPEFPEQVVT